MYFDYRDLAANSKKWYHSYNEKKLTIKIKVCDDETYDDLKESLSEEAHKLIDEENCVSFPMCFVVCYTCNGKGKYTNPSIDAHGITAEEWNEDWSHEEKEMYLNGSYDITCCKCEGKRVVPEIDISDLTPAMNEIKKLIDNNIAEEESYIRTYMAERAMGA